MKTQSLKYLFLFVFFLALGSLFVSCKSKKTGCDAYAVKDNKEVQSKS